MVNHNSKRSFKDTVGDLLKVLNRESGRCILRIAMAVERMLLLYDHRGLVRISGNVGDNVEEIKACQLAGRSIGKAWQQGKGKA